jgi:DNA replication protein DnaC
MKTLAELTGEELLRYGKTLARQAEDMAAASKYHPDKPRGVCPECGAQLPSRSMTLAELDLERHPWADGNGVVTWYLPCTTPECIAKRKEQEAMFSLSEQQGSIDDFTAKLRYAGIGALNMRGLTLNGFETEWPSLEKHRKALRSALDKMTAWSEEPDGFALLVGPFGVGKTRLAVGTLRRYLAKGGHSAFHFACVEGWMCVKSLWGESKGQTIRYRDMEMTQADMFGRCQSSGLLLLDDVDKANPSGEWLRWLLGIVNYRADRALPIIWTFNTPLNQAQAFLAQGGAAEAGALWSRVTQWGHLMVEFPEDQPDFRRR